MATLVKTQAADVLLVILSSAVVTIALVAVLCPYAPNHSLFWSEEVVRYLFVWFTFLGAAIALRDRAYGAADLRFAFAAGGSGRFGCPGSAGA